MEVIKSSIYYNKQTDILTLPNVLTFDSVNCSICNNNDHKCLMCKRCSLHDVCHNGIDRAMVKKQNQWPAYYCRKCEKNYYDNRIGIEDQWCRECFICNECHPIEKCERMVKWCVECKLDTYHCRFCDICLKHKCHGVVAWNGCGCFGIMEVIELTDDFDYSNIFYMDRCGKCLLSVDAHKYGENKLFELSKKQFLSNTLWQCRICNHIECGLCYNTNATLCSLCYKSETRNYGHDDDKVILAPDIISNYINTGIHDYKNTTSGMRGNVCGNICGICDAYLYDTDKYYKKSWFNPVICEKCAPNGEMPLSNIKKIRAKLPHVDALQYILQMFIPDIAYVIFEYYYEERHYLVGELESLNESMANALANIKYDF